MFNWDFAALRYILNFAIRQGFIVRNPVTGVKFLPEGSSLMRVVSHEEHQKYLASAAVLKESRKYRQPGLVQES